jgi:hypothetical protein
MNYHPENDVYELFQLDPELGLEELRDAIIQRRKLLDDFEATLEDDDLDYEYHRRRAAYRSRVLARRVAHRRRTEGGVGRIGPLLLALAAGMTGFLLTR